MKKNIIGTPCPYEGCGGRVALDQRKQFFGSVESRMHGRDGKKRLLVKRLYCSRCKRTVLLPEGYTIGEENSEDTQK